MHPLDHITDIQHIGLPTNSMENTTAFFQSLGFQPIHSAKNGEQSIVFLRFKNITIEVYTDPVPAGKPGAVDHIALNVDSIEPVYEYARQMGYEAIDGQICDLPFWTNGIRYFTVVGPNGEKIEFCQMNP